MMSNRSPIKYTPSKKVMDDRVKSTKGIFAIVVIIGAILLTTVCLALCLMLVYFGNRLGIS